MVSREEQNRKKRNVTAAEDELRRLARRKARGSKWVTLDQIQEAKDKVKFQREAYEQWMANNE